MNGGDECITEGFGEFELPPDSEPVASVKRQIAAIACAQEER